MKELFCLLLIFLLFSQCRDKEQNYQTIFPGKPQVPAAVKQEHEELLLKIRNIGGFRDSAGRVAIKLNELMMHHFGEEEDFVLPALQLLPLLADNKIPTNSANIIQLTDKVKSQLAHLSSEHQMIRQLVKELKEAALPAQQEEVTAFEKELQKHASLEEEILFPTALLEGEYLKLKTGAE